MESTEIRELSEEELTTKLNDLVESLFNFRFQNKTGQLDNPQRIKQVKRDIARIETIKRERNIS